MGHFRLPPKHGSKGLVAPIASRGSPPSPLGPIPSGLVGESEPTVASPDVGRSCGSSMPSKLAQPIARRGTIEIRSDRGRRSFRTENLVTLAGRRAPLRAGGRPSWTALFSTTRAAYSSSSDIEAEDGDPPNIVGTGIG